MKTSSKYLLFEYMYKDLFSYFFKIEFLLLNIGNIDIFREKKILL